MKFPVFVYEIDLDYHSLNGVVDTAKDRKELNILKKKYKNERPYHYIFKDSRNKAV